MLRMILMGLIGMEFLPGGIRFKPMIPEGMDRVTLKGVSYRDAELTIGIRGTGQTIEDFKVNGESVGVSMFSAVLTGQVHIEIRMRA